MNTKSLQYLIAFLAVLLMVTSCSRKKNSFINRTWHSVGTKYNILYNGNLALEAGLEELRTTYQDDYWEILPIERMEVSNDVFLPGQANNSNFELAEEKAAKAFQKHSMLNNGEEYNPQMDESFILLGKARYYDQRFIPALEAFNYILFKYPKGNQINQARIWREKTNIRLDNNEVAIDNLNKLLETANLEDQDLSDATAAMAQAYLNIEQIDSAVTYLEIASEKTKVRDEEGRYLYIRGQLYTQRGDIDSARVAYDRVIELHRKIPRDYYINAHLAKIGLFDQSQGTDQELLEYLTDLEENRENRPFLDRVFYTKANYFLERDSTDLAVEYYNKSLRAAQRDQKLFAANYGTLGDIYFDDAQYKLAGKYYDSTLTNMTARTAPHRAVKKKRENLDDVILYEDMAQENDSIINLVYMDVDSRTAYFEDYIERLKKQEAKDSLSQKQNINTGIANAGGVPNPATAGQSGSFYFYNPTTVAYGMQEFERKWGDRILEDNWRLANADAQNNQNFENPDEAFEVVLDPRYTPEYYIEQIPTDEQFVDSLVKKRDFAYYQLGVIYKEKFKRYDLSVDRHEILLDNKPEERLVLPTKYNLYRSYLELGNAPKANQYKDDILTNYPDSRYATIISNPENLRLDDENSPESLYTKLYSQYKEENYSTVIAQADDLITALTGEEIVPKFEMLKATATGKLKGYAAYKEALNFVALTYPNTPEGKEAQRLIGALSGLANKAFTPDEQATSFKLVYTIARNQRTKAVTLKKDIQTGLGQLNFDFLEVSIDSYDENNWYVVIHGLSSKMGALGLGETMRDASENPVSGSFFSISTENYRIVQIHKNTQEYLDLETN